MNATLSQLFYSGFSHWIFLIFVLAAGIFLGTMLGNLVFSPLVIFVGFLTLIQNFSWAYGNLNLLVTYFFEQIRFISLSALFVRVPGKTGTPLLFLLLMLGMSFLLLYLSERTLNKISLENNSQFTTSPEIRLPVCLTMIIGGFIFFGLLKLDLTNMVLNDYPSFWKDLAIQTIVIIIISVGLVYAPSIRNWWFAKRVLRLQRKS